MSTTLAMVYKLVERYDVYEALGNPIRIQALTLIALNAFLTEVIDECDEAPIQKAIAFTDELWTEQVRLSQRS